MFKGTGRWVRPFSRRREVKRRIRQVFILTLAAIFFLFPSFTALASYTVSYTVREGDTLYDISLRYNTNVHTLKNANNLASDLIFPGQALFIPAAENTNPKNSAAAPKITPAGVADSSSANDSQNALPGARYTQSHTVQPGDCLYNIALCYGTNVDALLRANGLTSTLIHPGQTLVIPIPADKEENKQSPPPAGAGLALAARKAPFAQAKKILDYAASFLGCKYAYGGSGPRVFDCSGFVRYIFQSAGYDLPHNAAAQASFGTPVESSSLKAGDLVFFSYYGSREINHVGIYAGGNEFIHASTSDGVKYSSLHQAYYRENYRGARRLLREEN